MRALMIGLSAALLAGAAAAAPMTAAQKQLVDLETSWSNAMIAKDVNATGAFMADGWTGQDATGSVAKAAFLGAISNGDLAIAKQENTIASVRIMGSVAVVQGSDVETSAFKGKDTSGTYSWTDVFTKHAGHWQAVASQVTKMTH